MRILLLLLVLAQAPPPPSPVLPGPASSLAIAGPTSFQESTLAQYNVPGVTNVTWMVFPIGSGSQYQTDNGVFIFTAPVGSYQILAATSQNNKIAFFTLAVSVISSNQTISKPMAVENTAHVSVPYSDISDEVYRILSSSPNKSKVITDARMLSNLYSFAASKIEMDGYRQEPALKTITQATLLVKSEERAMLDATPLKSLKDAYPDISKLASDKFASYLSKYNDAFSVESRRAYVDFLRALANGFDRVAGIQ